MKRRSFGNVTMLVCMSVLLSACSGTPFTDEDFVNKLFPNGLWDLIIQLLALIIMFIIVFKVGYKPVKNMLDKRKKYIEDSVAAADEARKAAREGEALKEAAIAEGRKQAQAIVQNAKATAEAEANAIRAAAEEEAAAARKQADLDIEAAKEKSKQEVRGEIIDVALAASTQILGREVTKADNERLLDEFMDSLSDGGAK